MRPPGCGAYLHEVRGCRWVALSPCVAPCQHRDMGEALDNMRLDTLPRLAAEYWYAISHKKPGLAWGQELPRARLQIARLRVDRAALDRYRTQLGSRDPFPLAYIYVLAQPAHFHLINHPDFPVRSMGLVHADNRIERLAAIDPDAPLALDLQLVGDRARRRGREFALRTTLTQDGREVVRMDSGIYTRVRGAPRDPAGEHAAPVDPQPGVRLAPLDFAASFGRRYARVSGDYNPIHLSRWLARPFGYRRAIAHGIGAMARIDAALEAQDGGSSRLLEIHFRRPLELPGQTSLHRIEGEASGFVLLDSQQRVLLHGRREQ